MLAVRNSILVRLLKGRPLLVNKLRGLLRERKRGRWSRLLRVLLMCHLRWCVRGLHWRAWKALGRHGRRLSHVRRAWRKGARERRLRTLHGKLEMITPSGSEVVLAPT